jgi:cytoskeletal protein CcmA (bactofilin family)
MENKTDQPAEESLETANQPAAAPATPPPTETSAAPAPPDAPVETPAASDKPKLVYRIRHFRYLYIVVYGLMVILIGVLVFFTMHQKKNNSAKKTGSLTSSQLAQVNAATTVVGDAKQTLDIQGNSIFEGQVLARTDLSVAGSLKVGGNLSLPTLNVGGQGSFGQIQVNGTASVAGDTTLAGQLTVQKSLTVAGNGSFSGSLSANSLTVTNLQFNGDIVITRHLSLAGAAPGKSDGTAIGGGGTTSVNGTDTAGTVTINTGGSPPAGNLITINFTTAFKSTPHVVVTPVGSAAAGLNYYVTRTTSGFTIATTNPPPAGSSFSFDYIVID